MSEQSEEDNALAKVAASGDRNAFETLVSKHYETIYRIAYKWCGKQADAEDITQNACIKLARSIGSFRGDAAFTSWLYRLVINVAKDWQRQQMASSQQEPISDNIIDKVTLSQADDSVYAQQVIAGIHQLPEGEKEALLLVVSEGLSHAEAAEIIGCKESTVSWRIHEARKKLTQLFKGGAGL
ncbi:MAG: RNA polymerase sigma factor [Methylococcales bacterium]|nr:RNA polymerase sigma factor [Methylococcales bacterium]